MLLRSTLFLGLFGFGVTIACGAAPAESPTERLANLLKQRSALIFEQNDNNDTAGLDREEQLLADKRAQVFFAQLTRENKLAYPTRFPPQASEPVPNDPDHVTAEEYEQHFLAMAAKYDSQVRYKRQWKKQAAALAASMPQPIIVVQNNSPKSRSGYRYQSCPQQSYYSNSQYVAAKQTGQRLVQNSLPFQPATPVNQFRTSRQLYAGNFGMIHQETSSRTRGMHQSDWQSRNVGRESESRSHHFTGNGGSGGSANHHAAGNSGSHHVLNRNHHK